MSRRATQRVSLSLPTTPEPHTTDTAAVRDRARVPKPERPGPPPQPRGNAEEALRNAPVKIEAEYHIPIEHHNPMEPHAAIAVWQGDKLTMFDKTQGVYSVRTHLATTFGVPEENVSVISSAPRWTPSCRRNPAWSNS